MNNVYSFKSMTPPEDRAARHLSRHLPDALAMPVRGEIAPCRVVRFDELTQDDIAAWHRLGVRAQTDNIFAAPWLMMAGLRHCDPKGEARLLIVSDKVGEWAGLMPVMHRPNFGRMPAKNWHGWTHDNQFLAAPLAARGEEHHFWRSVLKTLEDQEQKGFALTLAMIPEEDRLLKGLMSACADDQRRIVFTNEQKRPMLFSDFSFDRYWSTTVNKKRQDRLYKLATQLEDEFGEAHFEIMRDSTQANEWARTFLTIEQKGWRGRQGDALANSTCTEDYFRAVISEGVANGTMQLMSLRAGDRVCAMYAYFLQDGFGHGFKMVVDEEFAAFAPTTMILRELTKMLDLPQPLLFDSCAKEGQQPVSSVWMGRRRLLDVAVELKGSGSGFGTIMLLRRIARRLKGGFKRKVKHYGYRKRRSK